MCHKMTITHAKVDSYTCVTCNFLIDVADEIGGYQPHSAYCAKKHVLPDLNALYDITDELNTAFSSPRRISCNLTKQETLLGAY